MAEPKLYDTSPCTTCGACCHDIQIAAAWLDILREPRIAEHTTLVNDGGRIPDRDAQWFLVPQTRGTITTRACPFLSDKKCTIYPTRPNVCVNFEPGSADCTACRLRDGLGPLPNAAPPRQR
jgi:Fe-S-cluster containining protein